VFVADAACRSQIFQEGRQIPQPPRNQYRSAPTRLNGEAAARGIGIVEDVCLQVHPGLPAAAIRNPPSTMIVWAVTYDERSDSIHGITSAISEAVPRRPIAILWTTAE
jgi:hypothetical protein